MNGIRRLGGRLYLGLVLVFLYAPIFVLIVFSFNKTKSRTVWSGFTLDWYQKLFGDATIMHSLYVTLTVAVLASVLSTMLGTFGAIGIAALGRRVRSVVMNVTYIPVLSPDIITGVALMLLFVWAGVSFHFSLGFPTLLLAHISFDVPYVILAVMPKLRQLDPHLFEAALDLGADPLLAFRRVILPEILPGVFTGLLFAFTMSLDDFVISYFTSGPTSQTLSITIYAMTRKRVSPEINALSTLLFVIILIMLLIINLRQGKENKVSLVEKTTEEAETREDEI